MVASALEILTSVGKLEVRGSNFMIISGYFQEFFLEILEIFLTYREVLGFDKIWEKLQSQIPENYDLKRDQKCYTLGTPNKEQLFKF